VDFGGFPLWINLLIFAAAAGLVWAAGTRLAKYADAIGARTKLSKAFLGLILLGVATSLPEIVTTVTGAAIGNARLVVGNLFGGVALQIAVLAIVDVIAVRGALTYFTPQPVLLLQGVMLLVLLALALAGAVAREPLAYAGIGLTTIILAVGYFLTIRWSQPGDHLPPWRATNLPERDGEQLEHDGQEERLSNPQLYSYAGIAAGVILACGWALAQTGDALSEQTGLGATFVGVVLVAASTSMPELSTTLAAVRLGNHQMAVSNILGTNCLEVALFFLGDAVYRGGPILAATDRGGLFAATIGMVVTGIYLLGLLERRNRTVLRMGYDSFGVLVTYSAGLVGLFFLR
jgi:cation:H+ antiporter